MVNKYFIAFFLSVFMFSEVNAQWVSLDHSKAPNTPPVVTILKDDNSSTIIQVDIPGFFLDEQLINGKTFQTADLLTEVFSAKPGYPELPYITKILAIPDQSGISVEVLETGEVQTFDNIQLPPARESWFEGKEETPYKVNTEVYNSTDVYPKEFAQVDPPVVFRDFRIARISVYPLRYSPAKNEIKAISSITLEIKYNGGEVVNPKTTAKKKIAPSYGKIYRSFIFNYQSVLDKLYDGDESGHDVMLCIMPDEFAESFQPYADWKRQSGIDIHITKFSDIGANANNPVIIKNHITDAYHNWEFPPTYVLIVGDNGIFPKKIVNYDYSFPSENYFVEIDGNDFFPEMMIGRLTNQGDYRMRVMLNKFMKYEKEPYTADTDWFKKGICCSNNYYESQVITKRFTAQVMMEDGGFTSCDTLMSDGSGSSCSMDVDDIINAINEGRSYLNYRGEGWNTGWWANCYPFNVSDVSTLNNSEKLTFVTSIGCGVAMFDAGGGNCFGEEWVQLGSLTAPRGAVAFVGPTSNTHTTYNNRIDRGIYVGMFREGMDTPGEALLRGKLYMYNYFGDDPWVEYHYKIFCVLGDPSTHIWKDVPLGVNLDHPTTIPIGYNQVDLEVTFSLSELPVANAQVCITGESVFTTGYTDSTGHVLIDITPEMLDTLTVTVRGGNVIPTQETIIVVQLDELIGFEQDPVIIDLDGNTDGLINPNETCEITFLLKNWGIQTAHNVQATLSTSDTEFIEIITDEPVDFGDMAPNGTSNGQPFLIFVKPDCPIGQEIKLIFDINSDLNSWNYEFSLEVTGCMLNHAYSLVSDIGAINNNYRMDPGETVNLYISVENTGYDVAPNVMGILRSDDPYITIVDSIGSFGTIDTNMSKINTGNYFVVAIDESCPIEYLAGFSVELFTQDGNYPYLINSDFTMPVGMPMPIDFTGPDDYGYYAYSSSDTLFEQAPDYEWFEINGIGNHIYVPENTSDYTTAVNIPFDFQYYGIDYDVIRISTDGWAAFGGGSQTAHVNTALPHNDNINCIVAAFWDDLYNDYYEEGDLYYYNDEANHRFIIEWDGVSINNYDYEPKKEFFQVVLLNPVYYPTATGDGEIIVQYKSIEGAESNTVGIENSLQDIGLQYVFNENYDPTALSLRSEFAIKFTTETPLFIVSVNENSGLADEGFTLEQNFPNPFISSTRINYSLHNRSNVSLQVFNIRGKLVRTLQNGKQDTGNYSFIWNGLNENGNRVSSGIYFYRLQTDEYVKTIRMLKME